MALEKPSISRDDLLGKKFSVCFSDRERGAREFDELDRVAVEPRIAIVRNSLTVVEYVETPGTARGHSDEGASHGCRRAFWASLSVRTEVRLG